MTRKLPPLLQDIADCVGLDVALKLAEAKGGQRISVPGKMRRDHWLALLLGFEKAQAFSAYVTDGNSVHLDVPFGPATNRYAATQALIDKGLSANEIAAKMDITRRTVFDRKAKMQKCLAPPQKDAVAQLDFFAQKPAKEG